MHTNNVNKNNNSSNDNVHRSDTPNNTSNSLNHANSIKTRFNVSINLRKSIEDLFQSIRGNSYPGILYRKHQANFIVVLPLRLHIDDHFTASATCAG